MDEFVCATFFFSHWPVFLFTVKAVQEHFFANLPPPPPPKKKSNSSPLSRHIVDKEKSSLRN